MKPFITWISSKLEEARHSHWPAMPGGAEAGHPGRHWSEASPTLGLEDPEVLLLQ